MAKEALATISTEHIDIVKRTVARGATDDQLKMYLHDCNRRGVHPLDRLIHFTTVGDKYTPIVSIDFLRSQAASSGAYAGNDNPVFEEGSAEDRYEPLSATVTVYRMVEGTRCAFTATARWVEYCPPDSKNFMWKKMPHTMLGKCAEALALRKGFPQEVSGLYTKDELMQADNVTYAVEAEDPIDNVSVDTALPPHVTDDVPIEAYDDRIQVAVIPPPKQQNGSSPKSRPAPTKTGRCITEKQQKFLYAITMTSGKDPKDVDKYIEATFGVTHSSQILMDDMDAIVKWIKDED